MIVRPTLQRTYAASALRTCVGSLLVDHPADRRRQRLGGTGRLAPALFPITQHAHIHVQHSRELGLAQPDPRAQRFDRNSINVEFTFAQSARSMDHITRVGVEGQILRVSSPPSRIFDGLSIARSCCTAPTSFAIG
jgi:hypothetical protein